MKYYNWSSGQARPNSLLRSIITWRYYKFKKKILQVKQTSLTETHFSLLLNIIIEALAKQFDNFVQVGVINNGQKKNKK